MPKSVEEYTWRLHWTLVKGWTEFCAKHDWLNNGELTSTSLQKHIFPNGSFGGKPCRRHLILWQLSHLKFSSLFPEIKATWAGKSFLNWGFDRSIALAAVVQQFCKRHHQLCLSIQFRTFLLTCACSRNTHGDVPILQNWICSLAAVKIIKQYYLFFFKLHDQEKYSGPAILTNLYLWL